LEEPTATLGRSPSHEADLAALIQRMGSGDSSALNELFDLTSRLSFGLALRVLGNSAAAEEVVLETYTRAWKQAPLYHRSLGTPLMWLASLARTCAIDRLHLAAEDLSPEEPRDSEPSALATGGAAATVCVQEQIAAREALESMDSEQKRIIELAYFSGSSYSEIASKLGLAPETVKAKARLGLLRLQEKLRLRVEQGS